MKYLSKNIIDAEPGEILEYPLMPNNIMMVLNPKNIKFNVQKEENKLKLSNMDTWDDEYKVE